MMLSSDTWGGGIQIQILGGVSIGAPWMLSCLPMPQTMGARDLTIGCACDCMLASACALHQAPTGSYP